jgi:hypothetical protein
MGKKNSSCLAYSAVHGKLMALGNYLVLRKSHSIKDISIRLPSTALTPEQCRTAEHDKKIPPFTKSFHDPSTLQGAEHRNSRSERKKEHIPMQWIYRSRDSSQSSPPRIGTSLTLGGPMEVRSPNRRAKQILEDSRPLIIQSVS